MNHLIAILLTVVSVFPNKLFAKNEPALSKILLNNKAKKLPLKNNLLPLETSESDIVIEFSCPNSDSATYYYRINNAEKWHESKYPTIQLYDLDGGEYQLEIKAKTQNVFSDSLKFTIDKKKEFYQGWAFWPLIGLYILLIFGIAAYLFFLYDFRNKLKVEYMRNQIASDLHDEVGSNLNSIAIFIEVLKKKIKKESPELLSILDKISLNSEETVSLMRETVWSINPNNDSSEKVFDRMKAHGFEILTAKQIGFTFENNLENTSMNMTMEQRRNIYLIYKEAINNIVKHAKATKVSVKIINENKRINIQITDNGCGFDKNEVFEGNGLKNFQNRGANNGIEVSVDSLLKKGTTVGVLASV